MSCDEFQLALSLYDDDALALSTKLACDGDGTFPFEETDHGRHSILGRNLDTHMHVIRHYVAFNDATFLLPGQLTKDWP